MRAHELRERTLVGAEVNREALDRHEHVLDVPLERRSSRPRLSFAGAVAVVGDRNASRGELIHAGAQSCDLLRELRIGGSHLAGTGGGSGSGLVGNVHDALLEGGDAGAQLALYLDPRVEERDGLVPCLARDAGVRGGNLVERCGQPVDPRNGLVQRLTRDAGIRGGKLLERGRQLVDPGDGSVDPVAERALARLDSLQRLVDRQTVDLALELGYPVHQRRVDRGPLGELCDASAQLVERLASFQCGDADLGRRRDPSPARARTGVT